MHMRLVIALFLLMLPLKQIVAEDAVKFVGDHQWEKIGFDGVPIEVSLKSGELSVLRFPWRVDMAVPEHLVGAIDITAMGDQLLFTPLMDFEQARFFAESTSDGSMFVIDISSSESANTHFVDFVDKRGVPVDADVFVDPASTNVAGNVITSEQATDTEGTTETGGTQDRATGRDISENNQSSEHSFAALSRFALQSIYSPSRFSTSMSGVRKRNIEHGGFINDLVPGYRTLTKAEREWVTASGLYVTALSVKNGEDSVLRLDPRRLRHESSWLASAYWSTTLNPRGNLGDSTTVVVISRESWSEIGVAK